MTAVLTNRLLPQPQEKTGQHTLHGECDEPMQTKSLLVVPTCLPGGLCRKVGRELLEDVGHLLLHEKTNEVGGCVEL